MEQRVLTDDDVGVVHAMLSLQFACRLCLIITLYATH
jgi:hypothetical protein